jgi:LytR cell envelope-related transcriptional attenuator
VEHVYSSQDTVSTPWRTAAIVAAGVATVELFVLVVVGVVFGAKLLTDHAERAIAGPARAERTAAKDSAAGSERKNGATEPKGAELPRNRTSVIVLNGNGISGAAAAGADRLRRFHYIIAATGNAPRSDFRHSLVMYRPGFRAEAVRLGHDLHVRRAVPLDGLTRRDLQGAHLALIIGG